MLGIIRLISRSYDTNNHKGSFGEMVVSSIFDPRFFGPEEHYLINNLLFETNDGHTHQIDHVVVYKTGIFCIETKNITGLVLSIPQIPKWTVYNRNKQYEMMNPIMQNKGHVNVLTTYLNNKYAIRPIVVFVKGNKPKDSGDTVLNIQELKDYIKNYPCEDKLTSQEMAEIVAILTNLKTDSDVTLEEHVKKIKETKE